MLVRVQVRVQICEQAQVWFDTGWAGAAGQVNVSPGWAAVAAQVGGDGAGAGAVAQVSVQVRDGEWGSVPRHQQQPQPRLAGGQDGSLCPCVVLEAAPRPLQVPLCQWHNLCTGQGVPRHSARGSPHPPRCGAVARTDPAGAARGWAPTRGPVPPAPGLCPHCPSAAGTKELGYSGD